MVSCWDWNLGHSASLILVSCLSAYLASWDNSASEEGQSGEQRTLIGADGSSCRTVGAVSDSMSPGEGLHRCAPHAVQRAAAERAPLAGLEAGAYTSLTNRHVPGNSCSAGGIPSPFPLTKKNACMLFLSSSGCGIEFRSTLSLCATRPCRKALRRVRVSCTKFPWRPL